MANKGKEIERWSKLDPRNKRLSFQTMIAPTTSYGAAAWRHADKTNRKKIQVVQNKAPRTIVDTPCCVSNTIIRRDLEIPFFPFPLSPVSNTLSPLLVLQFLFLFFSLFYFLFRFSSSYFVAVPSFFLSFYYIFSPFHLFLFNFLFPFYFILFVSVFHSIFLPFSPSSFSIPFPFSFSNRHHFLHSPLLSLSCVLLYCIFFSFFTFLHIPLPLSVLLLFRWLLLALTPGGSSEQAGPEEKKVVASNYDRAYHVVRSHNLLWPRPTQEDPGCSK